MSERDHALLLNTDFTPAISSFFSDLAEVKWSQFPSCLFFRDFEDLPNRAPFDVDLLCAKSSWNALVEVLATNGRRRNLVVLHEINELALLVLVIDLAGPSDHRRHCHLEIRQDLEIPCEQLAIRGEKHMLRIYPTEVPRDKNHKLPVPTPVWQCLFLIVQALRKPDPTKYSSRLDRHEIVVQQTAVRLLEKRLSIDDDLVNQWLSNIQPTSTLRDAASPTARKTRWQDSLSRFCVDWLFFLPLVRLEFVTLHGPDGVGKSTTCNEIQRLFEGLPIGIYQFHHSKGWKDTSCLTKNEYHRGRHTEATGSGWRRILRATYRRLPQPVKEFWLWNSHFINYNRKFGRFIYDRRNRGDILLTDRYVYDVRVKHLVGTEVPDPLSRFYYRLHSALVPRPTHAFVLLDEPAAIVRRKQELDERQIKRFGELIQTILRRHQVPYETIYVAGRSPKEVTLEIASKLLTSDGSRPIAKMRTFVSRLEHADALKPSTAVHETVGGLT